MLAPVIARIRLYWHDLTGEARADLEKALARAEADEARLAGLVTSFRSELSAVIAAAEPQLKTAVEALAVRLEADIAALVSSGA